MTSTSGVVHQNKTITFGKRARVLAKDAVKSTRKGNSKDGGKMLKVISEPMFR